MNDNDTSRQARDWELTVVWLALVIALYQNQDRTGPMAIVGVLIVTAVALKIVALSTKQ